LRHLVRLFLNEGEKEELLKLHDTLMELDVENEKDDEQRLKWMSIISCLIFGKNGEYPVTIQKVEDK